MPSRSRVGRAWWLVAKEWRELATARASLLLALVLGPLVGHAFVTSVDAYAEASGIGGGPAALSQGLSPLDGLVVPTFGAYALAVTLLFPFVAIRLVSSEKESGALELMLQSRYGVPSMIAAKFATLLAAWALAWVPGFVALALWRSYGGHLYGPEVANVLLGHLARAGLVASVAMVAAAVTDGAATAAVVTLAFTLGTWALDFIAQVKGGLAQAVAAFTPEAALRTFEHGELSLAVLVVTLLATLACLLAAGIWLHPGRSPRTRWVATGAVAVAFAALAVPAARLHPSWDASEDRRNSFSTADERALRSIREPIRVTVYLAPDDPRRADLERGVLRKLRRTLGDVRIDYTAQSSTGLFEGPASHYGEVWYAVGPRRAMSRSTTEPIVLETIYDLAHVPPPAASSDTAYPGYPLKARATLAPIIFYGAWPVVILAAWLLARRRRMRAA